jgi:hypothetical protein
MTTQEPFPTCGRCGATEATCECFLAQLEAEATRIDLTDRIQCAICDDRGYVTTHVELGENHVTYTDPCPRCG